MSKEVTPFSFVMDLSAGKKNLLKEDPDSIKQYLPFIINKAFSYFNDTALIANEMNRAAHIDKELQHSYYLNIIQPKRRFSKWLKKVDNADVRTISLYFGYNEERAREVLPILSKEQLNEMKKQLEKGES